MSGIAHFVVNEKYLKDEKVSTFVLFWVVPKEFEEDEVNDNICTGHKEFHIFHKLKAGFYVSSDCGRCHYARTDSFCLGEICSFVKKLYPDYDFYGNKELFKNNYRRKKCVDEEERCLKEKSPVRK